MAYQRRRLQNSRDNNFTTDAAELPTKNSWEWRWSGENEKRMPHYAIRKAITGICWLTRVSDVHNVQSRHWIRRGWCREGTCFSIISAAGLSSLLNKVRLVSSPRSTIQKRRVGHAQCKTSSSYKRSLEEAVSSSQNKPNFDASQRRGHTKSKRHVAEADITPCIYCWCHNDAGRPQRITTFTSQLVIVHCLQCLNFCRLCFWQKDKTFICGQC